MAECILDLRLETSPTTGERLVEALNAGTRDFVLTSADGRVSARVRVALTGVSLTEHEIAGGKIVVDWSRSTVAHGGRHVALTQTELRLLAALLDGQGDPVSRDALLDRLWPDGRGPADRENALAVYICVLRKRLNALGCGRAVKTLRGVGYQITR